MGAGFVCADSVGAGLPAMAAHRPAPTPIAAKAAPTRDGGAGGNAGPGPRLEKGGSNPALFLWARPLWSAAFVGAGLPAMAALRPALTPIAAKAAPTRNGGAGGNAAPAQGLKRAGAIPPFFCGRGLCGSGLARDGSASPCTDADRGQGRSHTQWQRAPCTDANRGQGRSHTRWPRTALTRRRSRPRPLLHVLHAPLGRTPCAKRGYR